MRKLTPCLFATTALLALALSAPASSASAIDRSAGLQSAMGAGPVILVDDEMKPGSANDKKSTGDATGTDTDKKPATTKKARRKLNKEQAMKQIKQYVPQEYQQYLQQGGQGTGGAGAAGGMSR